MKFYKVSKSQLKWKEITQISYKWNLPILVDCELNVVLGNSLKDSLSDNIIIVIMDNNQREVLFNALFEIESRIAEENSIKRFDAIASELTQFFKETRKQHVEYMSLFEMKEDRCITPELYILPPPYDFTKHSKDKSLFNEGCVLMDEFIERTTNSKEPDIKIDLEIMKELL